MAENHVREMYIASVMHTYMYNEDGLALYSRVESVKTASM